MIAFSLSVSMPSCVSVCVSGEQEKERGSQTVKEKLRDGWQGG